MMRTWNKRMAGTFLALLLAVFALFTISAFPASAASDLSRLVDMADLLSDSEEADLSGILNEISERQQVDIVVVTVDSMEGETAMVYADDFYDYSGYGFGDTRDGILLLISMEERDWYISTTGYGITAITDAGREYISEKFVSDLSEGDYATAFTSFANLCDDFITQAKTGEPYDVGNLPGDTLYFLVGTFIISFVAALIIALIATGIMRGKLKSVHYQPAADNYVKQGSMQLTKKNDLFLYRHVDRRKKTENNSSNHSNSTGNVGGSQTHTSSSGTTHGGGGGKF